MVERLTVSKEKLKEYVRNLQRIIEELEKKIYDLGREDRILKGLVRDYQNQNRFLKDFVLMVFILGQLVIRLYFLDLFNNNDVCVIIF